MKMKNQIYGKMWNVYIYIAFLLGYCILYTQVKLFSCVVKWQLVGIIRLRLHLPTHDQGEAGRGLRVPQIRRTTSATTAVTLWSTDLTTGYISPHHCQSLNVHSCYSDSCSHFIYHFHQQLLYDHIEIILFLHYSKTEYKNQFLFHFKQKNLHYKNTKNKMSLL